MQIICVDNPTSLRKKKLGASRGTVFKLEIKKLSPAKLGRRGVYNIFMYYVYILRNVSGGKYVGLTENLKLRLAQHNSGNTKSTKNRGRQVIAWNCAFHDKKLATQFELYLKSSSGFAFTNKHLLP